MYPVLRSEKKNIVQNTGYGIEYRITNTYLYSIRFIPTQNNQRQVILVKALIFYLIHHQENVMIDGK
jgi:hypothetical protein